METALYKAIYSSDETTTQNLLSNGADPNVFIDGCSLLKWAILKGNINIIKLLVKYGSDVSEEDFNVGKNKHNSKLLTILTDAQTYISLGSKIPNIMVENRDVRLCGMLDPITHTAFEHGDDCVLVKDPKHTGPVNVCGENWYLFKREPFDAWIAENNTNPLTREQIDRTTFKYFTYYDWYA